MKKLAVFAAFLLSASTALAAKGSITVTNNGNHKIQISCYTWEDTVRGMSADKQHPWPGETVTVTCGRNILNADSPGCQITIDDFRSGKTLMGPTQNESGMYSLNGSWDVKETIPRDISKHLVRSDSERHAALRRRVADEDF